MVMSEVRQISSKFVQYTAQNEPFIIQNKRVDVLPIVKNIEELQENGIIFLKTDDNIDVIAPKMSQFISDLINLMKCVGNNSIDSFCYDRIKFLEQKFQMHEIFNHQNEQLDQKNIIRFYNVFEVDTHIHHSAAMSAKHLLEFIQCKYEKCGDDHVDINPFLYQALFQITGFDTVDDESLYEYFTISDLKRSSGLEIVINQITYWIYYIYANLFTLNALRQQRGLNFFQVWTSLWRSWKYGSSSHCIFIV